MAALKTSSVSDDGNSTGKRGGNFIVTCNKKDLSAHSNLSNKIEIGKSERSFAEVSSNSDEEMVYVENINDDEKTIEFRNISTDNIKDGKSNRTVYSKDESTDIHDLVTGNDLEESATTNTVPNELDESARTSGSRRYSVRARLYSQDNSINILMPITPSTREMLASTVDDLDLEGMDNDVFSTQRK